MFADETVRSARRKRQPSITREAILDSAESLFALEGRAKTTLDDIARNANLTRGAIYVHFRSKDDVFDAMFRRAWDPIYDALDTCVDSRDDTVLRSLRDVLVSALQSLSTDARRRRMAEILLNKSEFIGDEVKTVELVRANAEKAILHITRALERAVALRQMVETFDARAFARLIHSQFSGIVYDTLRLPNVVTPCDGIRSLNTIFALIERLYSRDPVTREGDLTSPATIRGKPVFGIRNMNERATASAPTYERQPTAAAAHGASPTVRPSVSSAASATSGRSPVTNCWAWSNESYDWMDFHTPYMSVE
ncbi:TetR family transcriptional regulator [Pandoraea captiosa]